MVIYHSIISWIIIYYVWVKKNINIMLTVETPNQTSPHHVIKPHNGRCCLMTNNIQTNTGCAKCVQLRFTIDYDWHHLGVSINCVQNANAFNQLIVLFCSKQNIQDMYRKRSVSYWILHKEVTLKIDRARKPS